LVRRACEHLGIDRNGQQQKLRDENRAPWARGCIMHLRDEAGREQEAFMLHLDSIPMWLATSIAVAPPLDGHNRIDAGNYRDKLCIRREELYAGSTMPGPTEGIIPQVPTPRNGVVKHGLIAKDVDKRDTALKGGNETLRRLAKGGRNVLSYKGSVKRRIPAGGGA
jgi:hypothetical protein